MSISSVGEFSLEEGELETGRWEEEGDFEETRERGPEYEAEEGWREYAESAPVEEAIGLEFAGSEEESGPPAAPQQPKFWWRTSGYNLDDFDLPQDPEKANLKLQAMLVEELMKRNGYVKTIKEYFKKNAKTTNIYNELERKDSNLHETYQEELKNLRKILDTFSDSYDDLNFRLTKQIKKCDKNDTLWKFFKEASRKILQDAQKRVDKKELEKYTKKQGLEKLVEAVYGWEERYRGLLLQKALLTLEIGQVKTLLAGEEGDVDMLQLAELQRHVSIRTDLNLRQELHIKKMQNIVATAVEKLPSKFLHMRYHLHKKDCTTGDILKKITKARQERDDILHTLRRTELMRKKDSVKCAKNKLSKLDYYLKSQE